MDDLRVAIEHLDGTVLVRPSGELDLATAPDVDAALRRLLATHAAVMIDLSDVTFADCAGLEPIRRALRHGARCGTEVRLFAAQPRVERVLHLTGLGGRAPRYSGAAGGSPG